VSILPINTHIECSHKSVEFLSAPPLLICACINTVFIRTHYIYLHTSLCVYVYPKTVFNKNKKNRYEQICIIINKLAKSANNIHYFKTWLYQFVWCLVLCSTHPCCIFVCVCFVLLLFVAFSNEFKTTFMCPLRECRLNRSGVSELSYYCAPRVCILNGLEGLAVWQ